MSKYAKMQTIAKLLKQKQKIDKAKSESCHLRQEKNYGEWIKQANLESHI